MTAVTYTYTNYKGQKVTTSSYIEFQANRAKGAPHTVDYETIYEEPSVNPERKRKSL